MEIIAWTMLLGYALNLLAIILDVQTMGKETLSNEYVILLSLAPFALWLVFVKRLIFNKGE